MPLDHNTSGFLKCLIASVVIIGLSLGQLKAQTRNITSVPENPDTLKAAALRNLRDLRTEISNQPKNNTRDSLFKNIAFLITLVPIIDDIGQLNFVNKYFDFAHKALKGSADADKKKIMQLVNQDLTLKLNRRDTLIKGLEPANQLTSSKTIQVHIYINGVETKSGNYRLYWTTFTGADFNIESIINKGEYIDVSDNFSNPCSLSVRLPGLITIWMVDTANGNKYKPDLLYKEMDADYKGLDLHFTLIR